VLTIRRRALGSANRREPVSRAHNGAAYRHTPHNACRRPLPAAGHAVWYRIASRAGVLSGNLAGGMARSPGPLEIVATEVTGYINHFANKEQAAHPTAFHGL